MKIYETPIVEVKPLLKTEQMNDVSFDIEMEGEE